MVLQGLDDKLNGRKGTAESFENGFYWVSLSRELDDGTCKMSVDPCNLRPYKRKKQTPTVLLYLLCVCEQQYVYHVREGRLVCEKGCLPTHYYALLISCCVWVPRRLTANGVVGLVGLAVEDWVARLAAEEWVARVTRLEEQ